LQVEVVYSLVLRVYFSLNSGNGACLTLKELANFYWNDKKENVGVVYEKPWDAE
jgi:hypothetical protein